LLRFGSLGFLRGTFEIVEHETFYFEVERVVVFDLIFKVLLRLSRSLAAELIEIYNNMMVGLERLFFVILLE
jgi:hypothetical protein